MWSPIPLKSIQAKLRRIMFGFVCCQESQEYVSDYSSIHFLCMLSVHSSRVGSARNDDDLINWQQLQRLLETFLSQAFMKAIQVHTKFYCCTLIFSRGNIKFTHIPWSLPEEESIRIHLYDDTLGGCSSVAASYVVSCCWAVHLTQYWLNDPKPTDG